MRLSDTIAQPGSYTETGAMPMTNLDVGGQFGHMNDYPGYVSDTPHVPPPMVARVIECPRGFDVLDQPERWRSGFVSIVERLARNWSGMNSTLSLETREVPFGNAGEMIEAPAKMTRARSQPSSSFVERSGRPITHFINGWGTNLLLDPDSNVMNAVTRPGVELNDYLIDFYGATVLFFIPDRTWRYIDQAWLVAGMFPKTFPPVEGARDTTTGGDLIEFSIEWAGVTQTGTGVKRFAQQELNSMLLTGTNPLNRKAFIDEISADVLATNKTYRHQLDDIRRQMVTP